MVLYMNSELDQVGDRIVLRATDAILWGTYIYALPDKKINAHEEVLRTMTKMEIISGSRVSILN